MARRMVLISNNPAFFSCEWQTIEIMPLQGSPHDVTVAARDHVHQGWRLLNHPLYGNFRPYHQPFRTLLLAAPQTSGIVPEVDQQSLELLEQALAVYRSCADRWVTPDNVPEEMYRDCSVIDRELMKATLEAAL